MRESENSELFLDLLKLFSRKYNNPNRLYEAFIAKVIKTLRAQRCFLMLYGPDKTLKLHTALDENGRKIHNPRAFSSSIPKEAVTERRIIYRQKTFGQDENRGSTQSMDAFDIRSVLCVPLITDHGVLGVIYLDSQTILRDFSESDRSLVDALCRHLALHIENAAILQAQREQEGMRQKKLEQEIDALRDKTVEQQKVIGNSPAMMDTLQRIRKVAGTSASVLLTGETGTGKEFIARVLHDLSPRKKKPFVTIDCTTIPDNLMESELFGHEKGSFTSALQLKTGKFERAMGGTIFLDEVGELPLNLQKKLLRVLQEKTITRVGGHREIPIDVRIIAATNRDLATMVETRQFRQDLYFRLNVVHVEIPPLKHRREDLRILAGHFLSRFVAEYGKPPMRFSMSALQAMDAHDWPGNVRELIHRIQQAVILAVTPEITAGDMDFDAPVDISGTVLSESTSNTGYSPDLTSIVSKTVTHFWDRGDISRLYDALVIPVTVRIMHRAMELSNQNKTRAAWLLGLERRQLTRRLQKYSDVDEKISIEISDTLFEWAETVLNQRVHLSRDHHSFENLTEDLESTVVREVFERTRQNKSRTCELLGISPSKLTKVLQYKGTNIPKY